MEEKAKLFQYAAIYHPTKEEVKNGATPEVIIDVKTILAKNENVVGMKVVREIPERWADRLENIEVVVRPF